MKILAYGVLLAILSGCGFDPMLSRSDAEDFSHSGARLLVTGNNENSYIVHQLKSQLKRALSKAELDMSYKIMVVIAQDSGSIAYAADATASRSMERLAADIIINKNGQAVFETKVNSITSFSQNANDEFINQNAQIGARERLIKDLVLDIEREVLKFARSR